MAHRQSREVMMVAQVRHNGDHRLRQAYQWLWRWAMTGEESEKRKESSHASSGIVRSGLYPATGEGSDD